MTTNTAAGSGPRAGRREWAGLAVLALPTLLLSLDLGVLFLALPQLSADLGAAGTDQLWITDISGFMTAGFLITMGNLGDRLGRRRLLLFGAAAFGGASVLAAYASSPGMLIAARIGMGIAAATLMPSVLALISTMFRDARQRGFAVAVWMSCFMAGTALGPLIGGAMLEFFWWGSVFLMGVPVMLLLLVVGPILLPEYRSTDSTARIDLVSVVLSLATILPVVYGITELPRHGVRPVPVLALCVGVAFGVVFILRQRTARHPLIELGLFRNRAFSGALAVLLLGPAVMGGVGLFVNQYLQMVGGLSPLRAGLALVPSTTLTIVGAMLAPALAQRIRPAYVVGVAGVSMAVGGLLLTQVPGTGELGVLVAGFIFVGFGFGPIAALGTGLVVGSVPPEKAGSAASLSETSSQLGMALGVAVLGSIGTAVYRERIADEVPAGLPTEAAAAVHDSLPGALTVAAQLPEQLAGAVVGVARMAFTSGLNAAGAASVAMGLLLAAVAVLVLRRVRPVGEPTAPAAAERRTAEVGADPAGLR
ncbi:MFS transporter [Micromonospora sp. NPDC023644]|uniref:MFS transporter n=1 Tax=Micromonospora sp. NPDC023644 TaxID=3154321 RepID=UPI0033C492B8